MLRPLAIGFGLLETLAPERIVDPAERLAFENPDDGRLRSWTLPMARLEGLLFLWLLLRKDSGPSVLRLPLGALGFVMALLPRTALEFGLEVAYENAEELETKSWVLPVTRLIGALYLVLGLLAMRADGSEER
ncbi:hypothetical protein [Natronobacterium texcoconense]|uniref:Uncharacterized protein n=1 Tax=Natronobacterium texcoconense TaxID=1095778 RepID=A0A1H1HXH5_NATTX|nr:hypothetical protein [Natronobacterium texcoconense]SDR29838.1 hypothetical protein SAMN04489842_3110 [Natronobacterium texcoconense]